MWVVVAPNDAKLSQVTRMAIFAAVLCVDMGTAIHPEIQGILEHARTHTQMTRMAMFAAMLLCIDMGTAIRPEMQGILDGVRDKFHLLLE